ncbi:tyrosine-type recombinase/integrase [bacterium]|nr:tyrosine-type recombinase/integrase [bacterium]
MDESLSLNTEHINLFAQDLSSFEQRASKTVENYVHVLNSLMRFAGESQIDQTLLKKFIQNSSKKNSKATQALWVSALRNFFRWARRKDFLTTKTLESCLHSPKQSKKLLRVIDEEDLFILDKYLDNCSPEEQLLFELLYSSALRFSEAIKIDRSQVSFPQSSLRIVGKGEKMRVVPATKRALPLLNELLPKEGVLWRSTDEARLRALIAKWGQETGIQEKVGRLHPHKLRHSIATHLVRRGAPLPQIQKLLGHSELATTQRYTHLDFQDLLRVYDRSFPEIMKTPFEEKKK